MLSVMSEIVRIWPSGLANHKNCLQKSKLSKAAPKHTFGIRPRLFIGFGKLNLVGYVVI